MLQNFYLSICTFVLCILLLSSLLTTQHTYCLCFINLMLELKWSFHHSSNSKLRCIYCWRQICPQRLIQTHILRSPHHPRAVFRDQLTGQQNCFLCWHLHFTLTRHCGKPKPPNGTNEAAEIKHTSCFQTKKCRWYGGVCSIVVSWVGCKT